MQALLSVLLIAPLIQSPAAEKSKLKEQAEAAVERIDAAFKDKTIEASQKGNALRAETGVLHELVIKRIAKSLKHKQPLIRDAAVESLGGMIHPKSLEALLSHGKRDRKMMVKQEEYHVAWIKAVGRQQDEEALEALTHQLFSYPTSAVIQARIFAIANIRSVESVGTLIQLMTVTDARRINNHMQNMQTALIRLTSIDRGKNVQSWTAWWRKSKKNYELPMKPPIMKKQMQARWDRFWGNPRTYERNAKRSKRGQDPEEDPKDGGD
ncbi:MAG TPA: hypothetical protein EYQ25_07600 [Planctomycetes bacterium]|nr:hypothetical protein [Planctomycetota bacterium]HIL38098.1 hypothetical protein [Planctomycetota bacterium]